MPVALTSERRAFLWRIWVRPTPVEANKPVTLDEIVCVLESAHSANRARVHLTAGSRFLAEADPLRNPRNQIYVAEIKRDPKRRVVTLLINRGDPDAVAPALLDASANAVRVERPRANEAPGWSAHLVISLVAHGGAHRACFEQMSRVSGNLVLEALDRIVARELDGNPAYTYEVVTKKGQKTHIEHKPYRPTMNVNRTPSETLLEDLEAGELSGITLIRKKRSYAGIGEDEQVRRYEEKIELGLKKMGASDAENYLRKVFRAARDQEFESVIPHVTKLPGGQSSNPTIPLDDEEALEHLYVRAKRLTQFDEILEQCYPSICTEIEDKLISEVQDPSNWPKP